MNQTKTSTSADKCISFGFLLFSSFFYMLRFPVLFITVFLHIARLCSALHCFNSHRYFFSFCLLMRIEKIANEECHSDIWWQFFKHKNSCILNTSIKTSQRLHFQNGMHSSVGSIDVLEPTFLFHTASEIKENAIIKARKGVTPFCFSSYFYDYSDYYAINFVSRSYFFFVILSFSTATKNRILEGKHCQRRC